jgi:hypothetical protein
LCTWKKRKNETGWSDVAYTNKNNLTHFVQGFQGINAYIAETLFISWESKA